MKRPSESKKPAKGKYLCADTEFAMRYPAIAAHLCDGWWDDGKPRECGSMTVRMGPDTVNLALTEPSAKASCYTTAGSLIEALELLNKALVEEAAVFRPWKSGK